MRHHRFLKITALTVASVLVFGGTAFGERLRQLNSNITTYNVSELLGSRPTPKATTSAQAAPGDPFGGSAVNLLVIGVDSRQGDNARYTTDTMESVLNDVNMVAHISADRSRVDIVAIPRDTKLPLSACDTPDGGVSPAQSSAPINEAFYKGSQGDYDNTAHGIACIMNTVEDVTGIFLNGYVMVDFSGFVGMTDALGGVEMCIPERFQSKSTRIDLEPGLQTLNGYTALRYARTRKGTSGGKSLDGTDLERIGRQQQLIGALVHKLLAQNSLSSLPRLNAFATAATQSLTMDPSIGSVGSMAGMAYSLRSISMDRVSLLMVPVNYTGDGKVRLSQSDQNDLGASADDIFEALATDQPVPGTTAYKVAHPEESAPATQEPSEEPAPDNPEETSPQTPATPTPTGDPAPNAGITTGLNAPVTCE